MFALSLFPVREAHPILGLPGFQIEHVKWCSMHTLNLGILQYLNGSIIDLLASLGIWNSTIAFCASGLFDFLGMTNHLKRLPHP